MSLEQQGGIPNLTAPRPGQGLVPWGADLVQKLQRALRDLLRRVQLAVQHGTLANRPDAQGTGRLYVVDGGPAYADVADGTWQEIGGVGVSYNIDGGAPDSVYLPDQIIDCGGP